MASLVSENLACINGDADFNEIQALEINSAIVMSLLEESLVEEHSDEQLNRVIRSLEAEINASTILEGNDLSIEIDELLSEGDQEDQYSCNTGHMDGHDRSDSQDLDFQWVDDMEPVPSSPSDDMNWYMESYVDEMDGTEFGEVNDYPQISYGIPLEEQYYSSSLWHETNDTLMYN